VKSASWAVANASMNPPAAGQSTSSGTGQCMSRVGDDKFGLRAAAEQCKHALARVDDLACALETRDVDRRTRPVADSDRPAASGSALLIPSGVTRISTSRPRPARGPARSSITIRPSRMIAARISRERIRPCGSTDPPRDVHHGRCARERRLLHRHARSALGSEDRQPGRPDRLSDWARSSYPHGGVEQGRHIKHRGRLSRLPDAIPRQRSHRHRAKTGRAAAQPSTTSRPSVVGGTAAPQNVRWRRRHVPATRSRRRN